MGIILTRGAPIDRSNMLVTDRIRSTHATIYCLLDASVRGGLGAGASFVPTSPRVKTTTRRISMSRNIRIAVMGVSGVLLLAATADQADAQRRAWRRSRP